ncbi:MAG: fasciclin domain-containing protein [Anaerolineae bacterium]|nr:fasciclin domain-containing protein [Anaerolineae bacterium]
MILPLSAQDRPSLIDLLINDANARFGLFLEALEAAGLTGDVDALENATLLIPTDDALIKGMNYLGLSQQQFFAGESQLAEILRLHMLPERLFFRDLSAGTSIQSLGGEGVNFVLYGGILWANGARVSDVDNLAASGVVMHVLDDLLLPAHLREQAEANRAYLRVAHLLPDQPALNWLLNGHAGGVESIESGQLGGWIEIAAGDQRWMVTSADGSMSAEIDVTVAPNSWITLAVVGQNAGQGLGLVPLIEDYSPLTVGQARLSFFNGLEDTALDLLADGQLFLGGIAYPGMIGENDGFAILPLPVATYDLLVTASGNPENVILNIPDVRLREGFNVFLAAAGTPTDPRVIILETNVNVARALAEAGRLP